jgi:hypothetical protein
MTKIGTIQVSQETQTTVYDSVKEKLKIVGKYWIAVSQYRFFGYFLVHIKIPHNISCEATQTSVGPCGGTRLDNLSR